MSAKINNRSRIHKGKVFDLISENITLENGTTTDVEFIEHPGATAIIPFLDNNRIVLLKQYRHALKKYIWEIPAGTLEPDEEIITCARRELIEETGYSGGHWHRLGEMTPVPGYSNERIYLFLARELVPAEQHLDADELIHVREVKFSKALEMIGAGEIQDAKSVVGLCLASSWLEANNTQGFQRS